MLRLVMLTALVSTLLSAANLYKVKLDSRHLEERVRQLETQLAKAEADVALHLAERAYLARPERIEALARAHTELRPTESSQIGSIADLPWREEAGLASATRPTEAGKASPAAGPRPAVSP